MLDHSAAGPGPLGADPASLGIEYADHWRLLFLARYSMGFRSEALREKSRC